MFLKIVCIVKLYVIEKLYCLKNCIVWKIVLFEKLYCLKNCIYWKIVSIEKLYLLKNCIYWKIVSIEKLYLLKNCIYWKLYLLKIVLIENGILYVFILWFFHCLWYHQNILNNMWYMMISAWFLSLYTYIYILFKFKKKSPPLYWWLNVIHSCLSCLSASLLCHHQINLWCQISLDWLWKFEELASISLLHGQRLKVASVLYLCMGAFTWSYVILCPK